MITTPSANVDVLWDELIQFIEEGLVVPVVGQDLLIIGIDGRQIQLNTYLAEVLADRLGVALDPADANPLNAIVCRFVEQGKPIKTVYSVLKMVMPPIDQITLPDALLKLADIGKFDLFVTTTFDSLLAAALDQRASSSQVRTVARAYSLTKVEDIPARSERAHQRLVYHLLGRLTVVPDSAAVTDEDVLEYIHRLQSEDHAPKLLFDELRDRSLLVIGCGFPDWLARFFIRVAQQKRLIGADKRAWLVDESIQSNADLVSFLQHFSQMTQVFPGSATGFVTELHRRWTARHPVMAREQDTPAAPAGPRNGDAPDRGVFLSYASEDRPTVEAIRQALGGAQIDVWFDKDQLEAGDRWSEKIKNNIRDCAIFVPILSQHALTVRGRQFRMEWDVAMQEKILRRRDLEFIVPVAIDEVSEQLPAWPNEFRECHWTRLPGGAVTDDLVERLKQLVRKVRSANQGTA